MKTVTAADANRYFSKLLADVKRGETVIVTSHGQPVARIVPAEDETTVRRREEARAEMLKRWAENPPTPIEPWTRDELYDDE